MLGYYTTSINKKTESNMNDIDDFIQFAKNNKTAERISGSNCIIYTRVSSKEQEEGYNQELIENHLPLVKMIAGRIFNKLPKHLDFDDLIGYGVVGLIEASRDPLFTISPAGKITDMNDASVKITGTSRKNLTGTEASAFFLSCAGKKSWAIRRGFCRQHLDRLQSQRFKNNLSILKSVGW